MTLTRLIYLSYAAPNLAYPDLKDILEKSERNNTAAAITGMLCFGDSMFLQILEGDRKLVSQTYTRILGDKRHFDSELIEFTETDSRLFSGWSMQVVQLDGSKAVEEMIRKYSSSVRYAISTMNSKQALSFMVELFHHYTKLATISA